MPPEGGDKTYVWAKLTGGEFLPSSSRSSGSRTKKRGAPTANADGSDVWGWAPGYYRTDDVDYHLSVLRSPDSDGERPRESEHMLEKSSAAKLFESGDLVLANPWEVHDFVRRLSLCDCDPDGGNGSESDEDDSDSDDCNRDSPGDGTSSFVDASDTSPPSNLIELTHLHEPSVVHALRHRYEHATGADMSGIYTDTGPILLAVNPFKRDESGRLYGDDTVSMYRREGERRWLEERGDKRPTAAGPPPSTGKPLPPHVYGVADRTFRLMMTRLHPPLDVSAANSAKGKDPSQSTPQNKMNQSVLVSGESGAGKTWTTKLLMAYLSKLSENVAADNGGSDDDGNETMSIERRILESNPIMESFGNARTIRNDNSSRFGKYIEMSFESKGGRATVTPNVIPGATLIGASIETYLLEKVRLVHQAPGERNYHIFYELFSMKDDADDSDNGEGEEREDAERQEDLPEKIGLLDYDIEDFRLLNTASDTYDRRDGVTDDETFRDMKRAMRIMGFSPKEIASVFEVTAALLHFSNLTFDLIGEVECRLVMDNPHLEHVVDLLGITKEGLNQALCYYEITIGGHGQRGGETHKRELSQEQAEKGIEALIKATYGAMFDYLVQQINKSVAVNVPGDASERKELRKKRRGKVVKAASIGILDIFGFESFQINSFEQLCINYCNEALQQQFNLFVLRNEQEEYDREGIPWRFIEFPENQDVLDLISFKGTGILNILHDQCRTPGASDENFALAIYGKCSSHKRFEADSRQVGELLFGIHHYAGLVEYTVEGFVEKTRDDLPKSGSDLLLSSSNDFVKTIAAILQPGLPSSGAKSRKLMSPPRTGGGQRPTVGIQFSSQLQSLRSKIDETSPHYIRCVKPNNQLVPDQFDAALVADQLRCAGVIEAVRVSRLGYPQRFAHSQFCGRYRILGKTQKKKKKKITAKALVHSIGEQLKEGTDDVGIQCGNTKTFLRRKAYDLLERLRKEKLASAAIAIQKNGRKLVYSRKFSKAISAVLTLQCSVRTFWAKKTVFERRQQHNAVILQAVWRKSMAMTLFSKAKIIACWCQRHARGSSGRKRYNELKRDDKAKYLQSQWRCYRALKDFQMHINAVLIIQCARRCYSSRRVLRTRKSEARDLSNVVQERNKLRQEANSLRSELECMKQESVVHQEKIAQAVNCGNSDKLREKDAEIESLGNALDQLKKEKENAEHELEEVKEKLKALRSEQNAAVNNLNDLKRINKQLQSESDSREQELSSQVVSLLSAKKELEELKESIANVDDSAAQENQKVSGITKHAQENELKNELTDLKETNASLQADNDQLKTENATLLNKIADLTKLTAEMREKPTKAACPLSETSKSKQTTDERSLAFEESTSAITYEKTTTFEERSRNGVNPSVCTSVTADMDVVNEEEMVKLREENQVLRKQLEFLRVTNEFQCIPDEDQDDSVALDSKSDMSEYIEEAEATNVPDSVMKQILSEVEIVTEEVIIKTRAESEAKIAELNGKIESLKAEKEKDKKNAKYDLDDMTRVNRSLRDEIEAINEEKYAIEEELEEKCDEFDALNEDVERFAETFAAQHGECQQLEGQVRNLLLENKKLTATVADGKKVIRELEGRLEAKNEVGSELGKLWEEVERLKTTSISSPPIKQVDEPYFSLNSTASDISR